MEIKLNTSVDSVARVKAAQSNPSRETNNPIISVGFESSRALEAQLQQVPDVRLDKLEKALNLIGSPAYPPRETINGLANLLATHLPHVGAE